MYVSEFYVFVFQYSDGDSEHLPVAEVERLQISQEEYFAVHGNSGVVHEDLISQGGIKDTFHFDKV